MSTSRVRKTGFRSGLENKPSIGKNEIAAF